MVYFLISLLFAGIAFCCTLTWSNFKNSCGIATLAAMLTFAFSWFSMWNHQPNMSLNNSTWFWLLLWPAIITLVCRWIYCYGMDEDDGIGFLPWVPTILFFLCLIILSIRSSGMVQADKQCKMLDVTSASDTAYSRDIAQIQPESMILVDDSLAYKYAEATLEQDAAMGSICEVGRLSIQNLKGTFTVRLANGKEKTLKFDNEQVYVAPLEHRDIFKWSNNKTTPGYILVSAMKQNVVYFVTAVNGEPLHLRYLDSGWFSDWWKRHLRNNGYSYAIFADHNIELDDNGRPFMIIPVAEYSVAYTCEKIIKVIIMDVQNGDIKEYSLQDVPEWVDRIYPSWLIEQRIDWWGSYQRGWRNAIFAEIGVRKQTPGIEQVYTEGNCYWYTGIMSGGADDGTSGFMLTNTRTGKSKLYEISGVNEAASREKIRNYKIEAANIYPSRVLMYNIKNEPTYFATCKSESGEFMGYAFASVKYRDVCGVGKTVRDAYEAYAKSMRSSRAQLSLEGKVVKDEKVFTVSDITKENESYYFLFAEEPGKEFSCPSDISPELKWTRIGDTVSVSYEEGTSNRVTLETFDNQRLSL